MFSNSIQRSKIYFTLSPLHPVCGRSALVFAKVESIWCVRSDDMQGGSTRIEISMRIGCQAKQTNKASIYQRLEKHGRASGELLLFF